MAIHGDWFLLEALERADAGPVMINGLYQHGKAKTPSYSNTDLGGGVT